MALSGATPNDQPRTLLSFRVSSTERPCEGSHAAPKLAQPAGEPAAPQPGKHAEASAGGGNRTHTGGDPHGILSPARLPVSPLRPVVEEQSPPSVRLEPTSHPSMPDTNTAVIHLSNDGLVIVRIRDGAYQSVEDA